MPTRLIPPASRMAPLTPDELQADIRQSDLVKAYGTRGRSGECPGDPRRAARQDCAPSAGTGCQTRREGWKVGRGSGWGAVLGALGYYHRENRGEGTGARGSGCWGPCALND